MTYNYAVFCGATLMKRTLTRLMAVKLALVYGDRGRVVEQAYITGGAL